MRKLTHLLMGGFALLFVGSAALSSCGDSEKLQEKEREIEQLRQLAELDRREMENQYAEFAVQYAELKKTVQNDSLAALLDMEQKRAEKLLKELKNVKANSSAEILRLKKELATVRAVLKDYIRQVDSLQRLNIALASERDEALAEAARTRQENTAISEVRAKLEETNLRAQHVYESLGFQKLRVNIDSWTDQLGNKQSAVDYELTEDNFIDFR